MAVEVAGPTGEIVHRCGVCNLPLYCGNNPADPWSEVTWRDTVTLEYGCDSLGFGGRHRPALPKLDDPRDVAAWLLE